MQGKIKDKWKQEQNCMFYFFSLLLKCMNSPFLFVLLV